MKTKKIAAIILSIVLTFSLVGCASTQNANSEAAAITQTATEVTQSETVATDSSSTDSTTTDSTTESTTTESSASIISNVEGSMLDTTEMFSDRDLEQTANLTGAEYIELISGEDVLIEEEGIYVLSGEVEEVSVIVEAADDAKIQIVFDGVNISNEDSPTIYVKSADKVFVTTTDSENYMEVTGTYIADGDNNLDAVIYSKSDLTLNGTGTLEIVSEQGNGVTSKDDLKVTGGTYIISSAEDGLEANDAILIYDGNFTITSNQDALHSENEDDSSLGYLYIYNGTFNISAGDDAIHGTSIVQIDGGTINVETCMEGIEGTYLQINGGTITIYAKDDGINATAKSTYDVVIEVNGGTIDVSMGSGDTDAFDSNGDIYINGGTISIEATSAFDSDGTAELNDGDVTVNGETITQITQSQMGMGRGGHR
ncbi:MAG: carbohydrate-binding domain-containing protein [Mobilitalea sp.]